MASAGSDFELGRKALSRPCFGGLEPAFRAALESFRDFPEPAHYQALVASARATVELPNFVPFDHDRVKAAGGYERHVRDHGEVPTRAHSWHDLFNLAVWAHWPRTKWALNRLQSSELDGVDPNNGRAPAQNVAAHFDECGVVVESSNRQVLGDLSEHRFKRVLWEGRAELAETTRFWIVGHGSLEALLRPHRALVGKALLVFQDERAASSRQARDELDRQVAQGIASWGSRRERPPYLQPLPLMGIPGFHAGQCAEFYDDPRIFRAPPARRQPSSQGRNSAPSTSQA